MQDQIQNTALITGASSGIGYELALLMAEQNFNLVLVARSKAKLSDLKIKIEAKYSVKVTILNLDLSEENSPGILFAKLQDMGIVITHLINNAGVGELSPFMNSDWDKLSQMINLNMKSLTHLCHLFIPELKKAKSSYILNVSSIAAFMPGPNMAVYYATKAYVQSFSEALAEELNATSVKVIALCPGPTISGFQDAASISTESPLFQGVPSSLDVAQYAMKLLKCGQRVGVHGLKNKLLVFSVRFLPRIILTKAVIKLQSARLSSKN